MSVAKFQFSKTAFAAAGIVIETMLQRAKYVTPTPPLSRSRNCPEHRLADRDPGAEH